MKAPHCQTDRVASRAPTRRAGYLVAVLGLCFSTVAGAFSIGHARIESGQGEQLQFSVQIRGVAAQEQSQLQVQVAPVAAWQELGLEPLPVVLDARVELQPGPVDNTVIARFYGQQPAAGTVIDALIDVNLAGEQQRHQVSMLQQPKPTIELPAQADKPRATTAPAASTSIPEHIEVRLGDTLHAIAQRIGSPHGTEFQVLAALYELNPEAFSHKNMNLLMAGETLVLPDAQQIQTLSDRQARHKYMDHLQRFNRYKEALARGASDEQASAVFTADAIDEPVLSPPVDEQPEKAQASERKADSEQTDASSSQSGDHGDRLRLAEAGAAAESEKQGLGRDDVQARQKALAHVEQEVAELESQVDELSEIVAQMQTDESSRDRQGSGTQQAEARQTGVPAQDESAAIPTGVADADLSADPLESGPADTTAIPSTRGSTPGSTSPAATVSAAGESATGGPITKGDLSAPAALQQERIQTTSTGEQDVSWLQAHFIKLMLALLLFIVIFTIWILRRANKTTVELESPDRVTPEMIQAKLDDINLDLEVPPSDEPGPGAPNSPR